MKRTNDLGRDAVFPLVLRLAVPTMLAQLVNVLQSVILTEGAKMVKTPTPTAPTTCSTARTTAPPA